MLNFKNTHLFLYLLFLPLFCSANADDADLAILEYKPPPSPENIAGVTKVDAEGLINLYSEINDLILIDARIPRDRDEGYIEGSISLPDRDTNCDTLNQRIKSKHSPALFYCNGPKCGRSAHSLSIALSCGYDNLFWFRGGIEEWKSKTYPLLY